MSDAVDPRCPVSTSARVETPDGVVRSPVLQCVWEEGHEGRHYVDWPPERSTNVLNLSDRRKPS